MGAANRRGFSVARGARLDGARTSAARQSGNVAVNSSLQRHRSIRLRAHSAAIASMRAIIKLRGRTMAHAEFGEIDGPKADKMENRLRVHPDEGCAEIGDSGRNLADGRAAHVTIIFERAPSRRWPRPLAGIRSRRVSLGARTERRPSCGSDVAERRIVWTGRAARCCAMWNRLISRETGLHDATSARRSADLAWPVGGGPAVDSSIQHGGDFLRPSKTKGGGRRRGEGGVSW